MGGAGGIYPGIRVCTVDKGVMDELSVSVDAAGVKAVYFDTVIRVVDWR
jgi:hypothetical protein